jgi:hypothetical protein
MPGHETQWSVLRTASASTKARAPGYERPQQRQSGLAAELRHVSIAGMQEAWSSLDERLGGFYEQVAARLSEGAALEEQQLAGLEERLEGMLRDSERIRAEAEEIRVDASGAQYVQVCELLLAAASIDAMLACDLALLDPDIVPPVGYTPLLEGEQTLEQVDREREQVIAAARALFRGASPAGLGGGADAEDVIEDVYEACDELLGLAAGPGKDLLAGIFSAASGGALGFITAAAHAEVIARLSHAGKALRKHAPRFLCEHVRKIVTLGAEEAVVEQVGTEVARRTSINGILVLVGDVEGCRAHASQRTAPPSVVSHASAEKLKADLGALEQTYRSEMLWTGRAARWLSRGGPLLSHVLAPLVGLGVLCGVFFVGLAWVGYSLADAVDARDLGFADRVEGIVRLVDRHVPPSGPAPNAT